MPCLHSIVSSPQFGCDKGVKPDWRGCSPSRPLATQLPSATDSQCSVRWGLPTHCWCTLSGARRDALPRVQRGTSRSFLLLILPLRAFILNSLFVDWFMLFGRATPDARERIYRAICTPRRITRHRVPTDIGVPLRRSLEQPSVGPFPKSYSSSISFS
jgi:hypothetical protein